MDIFIKDLEWLKYEGKTICHDYINNIIKKNINPNELLKDEIIKQVFNIDTLREFYILCVSIDNLLRFLEIKDKLQQPVDKYFLDRYITNKKNLKDCIIPDLSRYILYFDNYLSAYICIIKNIYDIDYILNEN